MSSADSEHKYFTPPIDGNVPLPSIGEQRIDKGRFSSPAFMAREWTHLWRKVWNVGPRIEELPNSGDYVIHTLGKESFLFTRGDDAQIRGFYNVCQHRGNQLIADKYCGSEKFFQCPFHAWSYNLDGSVKGIPGAEDFPQFRDGIPKDELGLEPIEVDFWGGFVWFRLDTNESSLMEFLGELPQQLAPYRLEDMRLLEYKTFLWDSNWKVACDAFN